MHGETVKSTPCLKVQKWLPTPIKTQNYLRFNWFFKMINTERNDFHKKAYRSMKNAAMLLLQCRPLRENMMFCTFEEVWGPATAEQRHWEHIFWERKELDISDISLQIEKQVLVVICASLISENPSTCCSYTKGLLHWYFGTIIKFCSGKNVCWVANFKLNTLFCEQSSVLLHPYYGYENYCS